MKSSTRKLPTTSVRSQSASAMWYVCDLSAQRAQIHRDYAEFALPTSNLIAKPEVGT